MPIRRYKTDPRTASERLADEQFLARLRAGDISFSTPDREAEAARSLRRDHAQLRKRVSLLGVRLGLFRRALGLSQEQVAAVLGTKKGNISRLESGRETGLSIERFFKIVAGLETMANVSMSNQMTGRGERLIRDPELERFNSVDDCLEKAS